jgi:hypothetical protein
MAAVSEVFDEEIGDVGFVTTTRTLKGREAGWGMAIARHLERG